MYLTLSMLVTERLGSHIAQSYRSFTATVYKVVTVLWVELGSSDDLKIKTRVKKVQNTVLNQCTFIVVKADRKHIVAALK